MQDISLCVIELEWFDDDKRHIHRAVYSDSTNPPSITDTRTYTAIFLFHLWTPSVDMGRVLTGELLGLAPAGKAVLGVGALETFIGWGELREVGRWEAREPGRAILCTRPCENEFDIDILEREERFPKDRVELLIVSMACSSTTLASSCEDRDARGLSEV